MSLNRQVYLYSVDTSAFYWPDEDYCHQRLSKLYRARKVKDIPKWRTQAINRLIKKEKKKLEDLLDGSLNSAEERNLKESALVDKNIISLFESSLTRMLEIPINALTDKLMILTVYFFQVFESLVKNGFKYNGERYIFLTASAGQIRTKRAVFIKETEYQKIQGKLMCGLTVEDINNAGGINSNKYLAYLALNNSATDVWEDFDIDKSIVVDDFETNVPGLVDFIDEKTYEITRKQMNVTLTHSDGFGLMLDTPTRMVRLPFVKGLLCYFPFDKFIREKCLKGESVITDIYGKKHDILKEEIRYIFTKSQFKLH